jgi:hypothetical protein
MWMPAEKRRILAKETASLPYLTGMSRQEEEAATEIREETIENVFDQFIHPDDPDSDESAPGRWNRARQLWKNLLTEESAGYFLELRESEYIDWIKTGMPTPLPCTTEEVESRNRALPELKGEADVVECARRIRATLLKSSDAFEQILLEGGVQASRRLKLRQIREIIRTVADPAWFIKRQPKVFARYKDLLSSWLERGG